jgi:hypothetical protein
MRAWLLLGVLLIGCDGDVTSDSGGDATGGSSADGGQAAVGGSTEEPGTGGTGEGGAQASTGGSAGDQATGGAVSSTGGALGNSGGTGTSTGGTGGASGVTGGTGSGGDAATGGSVASGGTTGGSGSGGVAQSCEDLREQFIGIYDAHVPEARACTQDEECAYVSFAHDCGQICPNAINVQHAHLIGSPLYSFSAANCSDCWEGHDSVCSQPPDAKCVNGLCTFVSPYPEGGQLVE